MVAYDILSVTRVTVMKMIVGVEQLILSEKRIDRRLPEVPLSLTRQIDEHGQIEPVVVRTLSRSKYEILCNAEAWLAVQRAGMYSVDIVVRDDISEPEALRIINGLNELDPVAEAEWYESQLTGDGSDGKFKTVAALARSVGKTRTYVSHSLRLLELGETLKKALRSGDLSIGHAKALLAIRDPGKRVGLATQAISGQWSVRKLESKVRSGEKKKSNRKPGYHKSADVVALERALSGLVGSRVEIDEPGGRLSIDYGKNLEVLDGILKRLGYSA